MACLITFRQGHKDVRASCAAAGVREGAPAQTPVCRKWGRASRAPIGPAHNTPLAPTNEKAALGYEVLE